MNLNNVAQKLNRMDRINLTGQRKVVKQEKTNITCSDGSIGVVNDDYCDCLNGEDELDTSACSNVLVQTTSFKCDDGTGLIFASRVHDGVHDCPDGSDERF
eukprot:CAMPEP_0197249114 /NCGR_PEP_ID=MMETSP1429-20130617/45087_1 /TAXON_ID=49237 /ORGANISM="Chaetoceros  sp., Strain UNC1202" /LENGTH=100 /DNA_ID=CAMNT_0042710547 /DNA_START=1 /DNA_END=303 /DNA_ORIENTATION=-